jgi:hypothetical protein
LNILFAKELDRRARVAHSKLLSLAVHPGISMTNIMVNGPGTKNLQAIVLRILAPIIIQPDDAGALPTLYAATSPDAKGGEYIGPDGFQEFKGSPVAVQPRANGLDEAVGRCGTDGEMRDRRAFAGQTETTPNEPKQRRKWGLFRLSRIVLLASSFMHRPS